MPSLKQLSLTALLASLLVGCGLEVDEEEETEVSGIAAQNRLLPLTTGTGFIFADINDAATETIAAVSENTDLSDSDKAVYSITMAPSGDDDALILDLESNQDGIFLEAIGGSMLGIANKVIFSSPIELTEEQTDVETRIRVSAGAIPQSADFTYSVDVNSANTYTGDTDDDIGELEMVTVELTGLLEVGDFLPVDDQTVKLTLSFSPGLGIIKQSLSLTDESDITLNLINLRLKDLVGIPKPLWFEYNSGSSSVLAKTEHNTDGVFSLRTSAESDATINLNVADFELDNGDELPSWISIATNSADNYEATLTTDGIPTTAGEVHNIPVRINNADGNSLSTLIVLVVPSNS